MEHRIVFLGEVAEPGLEGGRGRAVLQCPASQNTFSEKKPPDVFIKLSVSTHPLTQWMYL